MSNELNDIRIALEHQMALYGDLVLVTSVQQGPGSARMSAPPDTESLSPEPASPSMAANDPTPTEDDPTNPSPDKAIPADDVYARIAGLIPENSPLQAFTTLDEVRAWVAATELIELDATRINPVFGVGNPQADLMVIGEAPGADEDKQGEPFVGRAGQLLTNILNAIGFERSDVYIANILKSRPPNNRDPKPDEIRAHIPILHKQIALIQPKLILCVGRTSGTSLLGVDSSLKDMRGTFHDYYGIPVMVTYHPAALLRNPNWKRPTWDDVQVLRKRYDELTAPAGN